MRYTDEELEAKRKEYEKVKLEERRGVMAHARKVKDEQKIEESLEIVDLRATYTVAGVVKDKAITRQTVSSLEKKGLVYIVEFLKKNRDKNDPEIKETYRYYEDLLWKYILGNNQ